MAEIPERSREEGADDRILVVGDHAPPEQIIKLFVAPEAIGVDIVRQQHKMRDKRGDDEQCLNDS